MQATSSDIESTRLLELLRRRYEFLAVLDVDGLDKRSLQEKFDVSRSTIDRALRELEAVALVERTSEGYRTTLYGCTLVAIFDMMVDYVDQVQRASTLLAELPGEIEFSLSVVIDATIVVAEEPALHAPASRIADLVEAASEMRGLAYAHTSSEALELFQRQVIEEGMDLEIVFRREMYRNFTATAPEIVDSLATAENYTAYVAPDVPFGLFLLSIDGSERVCLAVYDDDRNLKGILVNDTAEAAAWADGLIERYRARSEPVMDGHRERERPEGG